MGLFDLFKKKEDNSPAKENVEKAREHYSKGEYQETLGALIQGFRNDVNYLPLYQLAVDSLGKLSAANEQKLFEAVCKNQNNDKAYNDLANFYFNIEHYDLAQVFLNKTLQLNPNNNEAIHDLAICYARKFQINKAIEILENANVSDFWNLFFLNKCKILDKRIDGVQESITELQNFLEKQPDQDAVFFPKMKVYELQESLLRYNTIPVIQNHIRDWQFIQYGGVILDYFETEENDYVAGGRYVASWGSHESIKKVVLKLKQFIDRLAIPIQEVVSLNDRDSEIIGKLIAKELNLQFSFYNSSNVNQNCLIVSSDSSNFRDYEELNTIKNGQVVFSVNHNWLDASYIAPDIIGFMTQTYSFPWNGGGLRMTDTETRELENIPPDNRAADEIVTDIYSNQIEIEDIANLLDFYADRKEYLKSIGNKTNNYRYNFMIESPVAGAYFGY